MSASPNVSPLATADWVTKIRRRQLEQADEIANTTTVFAIDDSAEQYCKQRRKRSRSREKRDQQQQQRRKLSKQQQAAAATATATSSPSADFDADGRPLLEIEKLLRGGLAKAYRTLPSSPRSVLRGAAASHSHSHAPTASSAATAPSFSFSLFPSKYHRPDIRSARRGEESQRVESARRKREQMMQQLQDEEDDWLSSSSRNSPFRSPSSGALSLASSHQSAKPPVLSQRAKDLIKHRKLGAEADQAPILRPQEEDRNNIVENARLFPNQFSKGEIQRFATQRSDDEDEDDDDEEHEDSNKSKTQSNLQSASAKYNFTIDPLAITKRAAFILETVDTPEPSDVDDGEQTSRDVLFEANQIMYVEGDGQEQQQRNDDNVSGGVSPRSDADGGPSAPSLGRNVVSVRLSAVSNNNNNNHLVDDSSSPPQQQQKKSVAFSEDVIGGEEGNNNDIGSLLLQRWHNLHMHDTASVSSAKVPWDPRMMEVILQAGSAEDARRAILMEKK